MLRFALSGCLISALAWGQSPALLESVRVQRPTALEQSRAELSACEADKCTGLEKLTLLTGVLELSAGDAAGARARLERAKAPRGLEAFSGWYLGEAQAWSGDQATAVKTLTKARKTAPPWLAVKIDRRLAELSLALGQPARAKALLEKDSGVSGSPELLLTRALTREALKLTALARADWKALALQFPAHPHGALAKQTLEATGAWSPTFDEQFSRAQALLNAGDSKGSLAALDALTAPKGKEAQCALLRGQALLTRGKERDPEAIAALDLAAKGPPNIAAQALLAKAKRLMRLNDNPGARATFHQLDEKYPEDSNADEAGYLAAWLAMTAGELPIAVSEFEAFETKHASSKKRDEARWFRAFSLIRGGEYAKAREVLQTLGVDFPRSSLVAQAAYWAARAGELSEDSGAKGATDAEYAKVVTQFPGTFYGLLAAQRLTERGGEAPLPFTVAPKVLEVKRPPALQLAALLAEAGLFRDATQEVARALSSVGASDALAWGHALQALGDFNAAHILAARYLWGAVYSQRAPEALALMYPRAFRESVENWSAQNGIEPALAWAIMRRESAFAPQVTSAADARGLMQIIPPTARSIAVELKVPPADDAELYLPEWNIRLGTWYLNALMKRLQHPTLVAGAYNGGPSAVAKWARERGEQPLDEWVEQIPFKETRGYVKQVTADLFIYRQLYGYETKPLSLKIPQPGDGVNF